MVGKDSPKMANLNLLLQDNEKSDDAFEELMYRRRDPCHYERSCIICAKSHCLAGDAAW